MKKSKYTQAELKSSLENYTKNPEQVKVDMISDLISYSTHQVTTNLINEEYDKAKRYDQIILELKDRQSKRIEINESQIETSTTRRKINKSENQKKEVIEKWKNQIQNCQNQMNQHKERLLQNQQKEIQQFEKKCSDPNYLIKYQKPSVELIQARQIQLKSAITRDFETAKFFKSLCDKLEKEESMTAQHNLTLSIQIEYFNLLQKHRLQLECIEMNYQKKINVIKQERDQELQRFDNRKRQLTVRLQSNSVPRRNSQSTNIQELPDFSPSRHTISPNSRIRLMKYQKK